MQKGDWYKMVYLGLFSELKMNKTLCIYLVICISCTSVTWTQFTDKIPVGVLYDNRDPLKELFDGISAENASAAFDFQVEYENFEQSRVRLQAQERTINMDDSFQIIMNMCNLMKNGIFALFGTHRIYSINTIKSYTKTFRMPFISPGMAVNRTGQEFGYEVYMSPYIADALLDLIKRRGWQTLIYMFYSHEGLYRMQQLFDAINLDGYNIKTDMRQVYSVEDAMEKLGALYNESKEEPHNIVLDMGTRDIERLFAEQGNEAAKFSFDFILASMDIRELQIEDFDRGGVNVTGLSLTDFSEEDNNEILRKWKVLQRTQHRNETLTHHQALMIDSVSLLMNALREMVKGDPTILRNALRGDRVLNSNGSYGIDCQADPVTPWYLGVHLRQHLKQTSFEGLTGNVAFDKFGLRDDYTLHVLQRTRQKGLAKIGTWTKSKDSKIFEEQAPAEVLKNGQRTNLNETIANRTWIVTSILGLPYLEKKDNWEQFEGNDQYEGYCADLAKQIAENIPFNYRIKPVGDDKFGAMEDDGTWNGMVGELIRKSPPFLMLRKGHSGYELQGNDRYEGYCADFAKSIFERMKMKYRIEIVKDGKYGIKDRNGIWNGLVGELIRKEADVAIAPLTITSSREAVIDFSKPFMGLGITIMIQKPQKESPGVFSFMYPLSNEIWMCVVFAYVGVSVVLFLVSRFSPFEWHIEDNTDGPSVTNNFTIFNSLWFSLGAFMQQGCDIEPRSMSGRIVGSVWWFFTLIVISSYTANLAAFLTVERMQTPIESADDLAKQTEIKYGTVDSGTTKEFFRSSSIPTYNKMWAFMSSAEPSVFVKGNDEGFKRVRESRGRYAFLAESTTINYQNQQEPCDTMTIGSNLDSKGYGVGTYVGSPLRDYINIQVLMLREKGELSKLEKKWFYDKGKCGVSGSSGSKAAATSALEWPGVRGIFYILMIGMVVGMISAACEFLYNSRKEANRSKDDTANSLKLESVAGLFYILVAGLMLALLMASCEFLYKSNLEAHRRKTTFVNAVRSKARLSIKGKPDSGKQATSYTYAPAAQLVSLDGYTDANTHTQV